MTNTSTKWAAILAAAISVSACGGGGSSGDDAQAQANALPADGQVVVGAGSTAYTQGTYRLSSGGGSAKLFGDLLVGYAYGYTGQVSIVLSYPENDTSKLIVSAMAGDARHSASSTERQGKVSDFPFSCMTSNWSDAEKAKISATLGTLPPVCPSTVSYQAATRLLTLNKVTLHALNDASQTLLISLNSTWVTPAFPIVSTPVSPSPSVPTPPAPAPAAPPSGI